jgi:transmembrane sensor
VLFGFAMGALAAVTLLLGIDEIRRHRAREAWGGGGPLALATGGALGVIETGTGAPATHVALADGSSLSLEPATRLEPLENTAHALVLLLAGGRATFDVHPGGPRRWSIECGLATVEVVGTGFTLSRLPDRLEVDVDHGTVLVRGERVRDRVQRLTAGAHLEVSVAAAPSPAPPPSPPATQAPAAPPAPPQRAWRELATHGAYADAYRLLGPNGMGSEVARSASPGDLMTLADVARLSGHPAEAVAPLTRVISEHPDDSRAPLAAFTLGKIHLNASGQAAAAADDFGRAILLGLSSGLLDDAYAYLVEARSRAGDARGARAAAEAYARRFPDSPRAKELVARTSAR